MTTGQAIQRAVIALALLLASPARGEMEWFWDNQTSPSLAIGTVMIVNDTNLGVLLGQAYNNGNSIIAQDYAPRPGRCSRWPSP